MTQPLDIAANSDGMPHQDYILIGTDRSPGKATVLSGSSPRGWDERQGYATDGATLVPKGNPLGVHKVQIELWTRDHYEAWKVFAAKYLAKSVRFKPGTTTPRALGIYHPVLASPPISVTEVVVDDVTDLVQDDDGMWSCEITFHEYGKPRPAMGRPDAAIPAAQGDNPTAKDAADQEMQQKLFELKAIGKELAK